MRTITERGSLWELAVLSLVREEPMHPYLMQRLLRERHKDDVLVLKRGSLYHAIERLVSGGLIEPVSVGREGRRPARTTYRLTRAGEEELVTWLKQRVATIQRSPSEFMGTLSFLVHLSPAEAAAQLGVRASTLERHIAESSAALAQITQFVGRINLIETEYSIAMLKAELQWVRHILAEARSGKFTWDLKEILKAVRAARRQKASRKGRHI